MKHLKLYKESFEIEPEEEWEEEDKYLIFSYMGNNSIYIMEKVLGEKSYILYDNEPWAFLSEKYLLIIELSHRQKGLILSDELKIKVFNSKKRKWEDTYFSELPNEIRNSYTFDVKHYLD